MPVLGAIRSFAATASTRKLRVGGLALLLALLTTVATTAPTFAWATSAFSPSDEQLLFTLTNQDRASAGLNALTNDSYLHKEAEWRAQDMGDRDYFSHQIPPNNTTVFNDMQKDHYCFKVAGENIGLSTFSDSSATTRIETAFMGSADHRANILGTWQRMGVGAYKAADGRKLYVVLFSVPCASKPKAASKPAPKATPKATPQATPTVGPTAQPTPEPSATVPAATPEPSATPAAVGSPTGGPDSPDRIAPTETSVSLRVRDGTPSQGPVDSLFKLLFGGLFG
jgi:uncharacterized protein YkwD